MDSETQAIQRQFERVDGVLLKTLLKDGGQSEYENYAPAVDRDLPENPNDLRDPHIAYRYAMKRLYRRQFDVTMAHERKDGCWPLIAHDLLDEIDGRRMLIVDVAPESVLNHASTEYIGKLDRGSLNRLGVTFETVRADAVRRIANLGQKRSGTFRTAGVGEVIDVLIKIATLAEAVVKVVEYAKDAWDKREAQRKEVEEKERARLQREAAQLEHEAREHIRQELRERSIPDGSGHMDLYEKNKENIQNKC